jgi:hypothetical protein
MSGFDADSRELYLRLTGAERQRLAGLTPRDKSEISPLPLPCSW